MRSLCVLWFLCAVLSLLLGVPSSAAVAATIDIGQAFGGTLQEIVNSAVSAALAALVGWVAWAVKSKFNIDIAARHRDALTSFLQRRASGLVAAGAVKVQGLKLEVQSEQLAMAAKRRSPRSPARSRSLA